MIVPHVLVRTSRNVSLGASMGSMEGLHLDNGHNTLVGNQLMDGLYP